MLQKNGTTRWRVDNMEVKIPLQLERKLNSVALVRKRTIPTERSPLAGEISATFTDRKYRVVSATDSHCR
jgi:hypothetical protein